jgi:hypothetical protein
LKYLTNNTPFDILKKSKEILSGLMIRKFEHPLMETDVEVLENELKKKNKKEKINRLKRLGDFKYLEIIDLNEFKSTIDEMALQSDFRKGAFYNKTFFHDEPERKTFILKLFDLGLVHVSCLAVDNTLIASNVGFVGEDRVHLQGINSHSPFYSKYSPGILQFLMLGIELKKSGFRYFDLTPGGADGYKSMLATETSEAYEIWFTQPKEALKKRLLEKIKKRFKPILDGRIFWGEDLSNLNMATMRFKIKLKFLTKKVSRFEKSEYFNFLEEEVLSLSNNEMFKSLDMEEEIKSIKMGEIKENYISDLFLFKENNSTIPRMDFFTDCINRIEFGQTMFTYKENTVLKSVCWFVPPTAKNAKVEIKETQRPPLLVVSYYKEMSSEEIIRLLKKIVLQLPDNQKEGIYLEVGKKQKGLIKLANL